MGTRGITAVYKDGEFKISQYGQWDHYPDGQGVTILNFISSEENRKRLLDNLSLVYTPTKEVVRQWYIDAGDKPDNESGWIDYEVGNLFSKSHPSMSRDMGGKILQYIADSTDPVPINIDTGFFADSLFCEWAYIIDFDSNKFEVYRGFQKEPLTPEDRFYSAELHAKGNSGDQYYPVKIAASFDLNNLPDKQVFYETFYPPEKE